jgi:hypothetical protein
VDNNASNLVVKALRELLRLKDLKTDANAINTSGSWSEAHRQQSMLKEHDAKKGEAWDAARRALHAFDAQPAHEDGRAAARRALQGIEALTRYASGTTPEYQRLAKVCQIARAAIAELLREHETQQQNRETCDE